MRLVIASRQSDLARLQALVVAARLREEASRRGAALEIVHHFRESLGDQQQDNPLWQMPAKGVFTEDFRQGLASGEFDLVVHSWKDLPTEERPESEIAATLPRADARDVLLVRRDVFSRSLKSWRVLSSSPRRAHFLGEAWAKLAPAGSPPLEFHSVRGNIPTRLLKLHRGEGEALLVAKAALDRLLATTEDEFAEARRVLRMVIDDCQWMVLPLSIQPPAPAQGALAIEIRRDRADLRSILEWIHCPATFSQVQWEREQLRRFGGGCHLKLGALAVDRAGMRIQMVMGQPPEGSRVEEWQVLRPARAQSFRQLVSLRSEELFEMRRLNLPTVSEALYLAHSRAWPDSHIQSRFVWTAGLRTWESLARRGVWVNGSDESWGEARPAVDELVGRRLDWDKLTHRGAPSGEGLRAVASYELTPRPVVAPDVLRKLLEGEAFYWHSGSALRRAFDLVPELEQRHHSAGLGHTRQALAEIRGRPLDPTEIFLHEDEWRRFYEQ